MEQKAAIQEGVMNFMPFFKKSGMNWNVKANSMMIKAKNIIVKERIWTSRVISKVMKQQPLDTTLTLSYTMSVSLQFERNRYAKSVQ